MGLIRHSEAWEFQKKLLAEIQDNKRPIRQLPSNPSPGQSNYLIFCEHPHVYTLGKSGKENNLLVDEEFLKKAGAELYRIDRGGDITYHGPGQIVGYPIFDLESFGLGVKQYIYNLEEIIILTLRNFLIKGERLSGATGVWIDTDIPEKTRKICAIGVKVSRAVTMHGFAFNINTDLDFYNIINPCGFTDKGVTSVQKETGREIDIQVVKQLLVKSFEEVFKLSEIIRDYEDIR